MAGWRLGKERRQSERFKVGWVGTLTCLFQNHEENVEVRVAEVSSTGARLELETLRIGQHHIVIGSESSRFTLKVNLPEAALLTPVRIVWYSTDQEKDLFNVGVVFVQTSEDRRASIEKLLADVAHGPSTL
ncbi:MAG TPA: PilZ domain-containing protein [Syntrophobacteraceae bacterium]|nr:PilZ domain-containing protein [Syntrophobacteraceae bacterium]